MSLITRYATLEAQLKDIQAQMKALESDKGMKKELEFKEKVEKVMREYDKTAEDIIALFSPQSAKKVYVKQTRKPRKLRIFKNPNTGEVIETRGGNHKGLRDWKDEYGAETVESWDITQAES